MAGKRGVGRPPYPDILTRAEWGVVEAVRHGMSNAEIARRRGVSPDAVKFHLANALGKLGLADRKALRAWDGVRRDSPLHFKESDMQQTLALGPIGQISRSVGDIAAAERWYRDVLGLKHLYTFGKLAFFDCAGVRLFLEEGPKAGGRQSVIYFRVPDIRAAFAELTANDVAFDGAPHMIHRHADGMEEWMAFFRDPDGAVLALMSQVAASSAAQRASAL
jgi:DNA-binding CsgD family transcriptional regulator/catechol 2,3-dioxygenase-like lactoylglutathione lyase family enzyme